MRLIHKALAMAALVAVLSSGFAFADDHRDNHAYVKHEEWKKGYHMQHEDWDRGERRLAAVPSLEAAQRI